MTTNTQDGKTAAPEILGVHHSAYRCRDAEETRAFYEDLLGLRTRATLSFEKDPAGNDKPFMHLFFEMGDKNMIAFFDIPETVDKRDFNIKDGMEDYHVAMEVKDMDALMQFKQRLEDYKVPVFGPIDHHFCHSIYFFDPNGIALEFTTKDSDHDKILDKEEADSRAVMKEWIEKTAPIRAEKLKTAS